MIFTNFGIKNCSEKNTPKKITLVFECYNFMNPMELGAVIF
jgi:hypothetical protein